MKHVFIFAVLAALTVSLSAQNKYLTKNGTASFRSETPVETIEAENKQVTAILTSEGKMAFKILMKSFEFPKALMQEHFNENYVESDTYPQATFEGQIVDFNPEILQKEGTYEVEVAGNLTIHGESKETTEKAKLMVGKEGIQGLSTFSVLLADYKVEIPSAVADKIEKSIEINIDVMLKPFSR